MMAHRGSQAKHQGDWERAQRRDGYADGKSDRGDRGFADQYYQRGLREGKAAAERAHERHGGDESPDRENCVLCDRYVRQAAVEFAPPRYQYSRADLEEIAADLGVVLDEYHGADPRSYR